MYGNYKQSDEHIWKKIGKENFGLKFLFSFGLFFVTKFLLGINSKERFCRSVQMHPLSEVAGRYEPFVDKFPLQYPI